MATVQLVQHLGLNLTNMQILSHFSFFLNANQSGHHQGGINQAS